MKTWYASLFGVAETDRAPALGFRVDGERLVTPDGRSFGIGRFAAPRLDELRAHARSVGESGELRIVHEAIGDVLELHARPENAGAMFQVASQLNALEFPSPSTVPEDGVTGYAGDPTQGPACALAAAAATVYRNDFLPVDGHVGQSERHQLELAADLEAELKHHFFVQNGYLLSTPDRIAGLEATLADRDHAAWCDLVRIGVQSRVEVTFAQRFVAPEAPQHVSQAFCSAAACGYAPSVSPTHWAPLATVLLDALYEATLWAAVIDRAEGRGTGKVWLTFVGGGVFGNAPRWIAHAIRRAVDRARGFALDVHIAHYRSLDPRYVRLVDG
ncbi:MAG: hypothetical protein AAF602_20480 [Myxococcota bacterium]